ncbi:hypothetical protein [Marinilabilia sp.]|uniref:hypothetical protein n=1 Tax=Marinilabilia sp. TaxID=2021252 RepID=UPI0025BF7803|nr:hypothetical protein [Marinilabilia sp.]
MRFKKKPQYRAVVPGIIIVLLALFATHATNIPLLWSGFMMGFGTVLFFNGFIQGKKEHGRLRLFSKKTNNNRPLKKA